MSVAVPQPRRSFRLHGIGFDVYATADEMGAASAHRLSEEQIRLAGTQDEIGFLIMAAPSAFPFYRAYLQLAESSAPLQNALAQTHFFQFDDYPLPASHPATFRHLLETHLYAPLRAICPGVHIHPLNVDADDPGQVCRDYAERVLATGPDIQLKGVGENGHWGFHEPGIPLDGVPAYIRVETSDENTAQQLRDHPGLFKTANDVPRDAYTANVQLFLRTRVCIEDNVPQASKALALLAGYGSPKVDAAVPTSALKQHPNATVRTTEAAAWALEKYADTGHIAPEDVARLANSLGSETAYVTTLLETMDVQLR